mmetsp:Transcript_62651/g.183244  ORF Transcript_62651/g.183244 Transcript_62651/m.183244 type:complete len:337 (-) Transcript_62651:168-1178(-)
MAHRLAAAWAQRSRAQRGAPASLLLLLCSAVLGALASHLSASAIAAAVASRPSGRPKPPTRTRPAVELALGRRGAAGAALAVLGGAPPLVGGLPAWGEAAKRGWQMRLPPTWRVYDQKGVPDLSEAASRQLLLGGDASQKAEVKVVRVPLATSKADPQGLGGLALIEYFSTAQGQEPRVTTPQVVDVLSKGFSSMPAMFSFDFVGTPSDEFRNTTKYLRYEYEAARCEGAQVQGTSGKICQRSDNGEILPVFNRHHAILSTVVAEPTEGRRVADGLLVSPKGAEVLWVVDVSAPAGNWTQLTGEVQTMLGSFGLGLEDQLAAKREVVATAGEGKAA